MMDGQKNIVHILRL